MTDENAREVYSQSHAAQEKQTYYLLAATGAAIAYALNQTKELPVSLTQIPLGLGMISWGASFFCGSRQLHYKGATLYANLELFRVGSGKHPKVGNNPQMISAACEGIRQAMEENSDNADRFGRMQFIFFVLGALLYIIWHVIEMCLR